VYRLVRVLKLAPLAFAELRAAEPGDPAAAVLGRDEPRQRIWLRQAAPPRPTSDAVVTDAPAVTEPAERRCLFLFTLAGGYARCGLLGARPLACRTYPTWPGTGRVELRGDRVCPELSFPHGAGAEGLDWAARWAERRAWQAADELLVAAWNGQVESLPWTEEPAAEHYLAFVLRLQARADAWHTRRQQPPLVAMARVVSELVAAAEPEPEVEPEPAPTSD